MSAMLRVGVALTTTAMAHGAADAVSTMTMDDVQELLVQHNLQPYFSEAFKQYSVDGSLIDAMQQGDFAPEDFPDAKVFHWRKFWTVLENLRRDGDDQAGEAVIAADGTATTSNRRRLLDDASSGLLIKNDNGAIGFGVETDVTLSRSGSAELTLDGDLQVTGDTNVGGSLKVNGQTCTCLEAPCPIGGATSGGASAEQFVSSTMWTDIGMTTTVETYADSDRVLLLANVNFNPEDDGHWGEFTIFRGNTNLGTLQRLDGLDEHNMPANMVFMDEPGMTGPVTYTAKAKLNGGDFSVSEGSLLRHLIAVRADKDYSAASTPMSNELGVDSTDYQDLGMSVSITTETDDEAVLVVVNANYDADEDNDWGYFTIYADGVEQGPLQAVDGLQSDNAIANMLYLHVPGAAGTHTYDAYAKMSGTGENFDVSEGSSLVRQISALRVGTNFAQTMTTTRTYISSTTDYEEVGLNAEITTEVDGQSVLVTVNTNFNPNEDSAAWGWLTIYRDDTDLGPLQIIDHPDEDNRVFNAIVLDAPATAGTYTYKAMMKACSSCSEFDINQHSYSQIAVMALPC